MPAYRRTAALTVSLIALLAACGRAPEVAQAAPTGVSLTPDPMETR